MINVRARPSSQRPWRVTQLLKDVEPQIEEVVAEQAAVYWNRPARRAEHHHGQSVTVAWTIEGVELVAVTAGPRGPAHVVVHDIRLLKPLRQRLRGGRAVIEEPAC